MKIDGFTPEEWCDDQSLILVITSSDEDKRFREHYENGSASWPPLSSNGDDWHIQR